MKAFSLNKKKKDFEKQKKIADEEACAEAYEEFVATFEAPKSQSKLFVRGNVINPGSGQTIDSPSNNQAGKLYKPEKLEEFDKRKKSLSSSQEIRNSKNKDEKDWSFGSRSNNYSEKPPKKKGEIKRKSNLEMFKEELKMLQEERQERHQQRLKSQNQQHQQQNQQIKEKSNDEEEIRPKGSYDTGDPNTTNIYLGNLSPKVTENQLCDIFGRYGPLASVKIMWPRSEEERTRNRNCGFVAYMCRVDGERAMKAMNGRIVSDYEMRLGWGKAVPIPLTPIYIPPVLRDLTMPPPPSGLPFNAQVIEDQDKELLMRYQNDPQKLYRENKSAFDELLSRSIVKVVMPSDRSLICLIHRVIEFIVREGPLFEALLMSREVTNPQYSFLFENQSPSHVYYRWRLFSILNGEHPSRWRAEEFRMFKGGSIWRPPPVNLYLQGMPEHLLPKSNEFKLKNENCSHGDDSFDSDSDNNDEINKQNERSRKKRSHKKNSQEKKSLSLSVKKNPNLSREERENLDEMLRSLNPQRSKIADLMIYCIENAEHWEEIVECITDSLCIYETPFYKKIARLFLVSDILHNCSVKVANVSNYRKGFQSKLPAIFESFYQVHKGIEGRLKAEHFKQRVMNCFRAWEETAIYSSDFLIRLQNIFLGLTPAEKPKTTFENSLINSKTEDIDGVPFVDPNLDGEELKNHEFFGPSDPFSKKFKSSKWETIDPELEESRLNFQDSFKTIVHDDKGEEEFDDGDIDGKPLDESDYFGSLFEKKDETNNKQLDNAQSLKPQLSREILREIELKVIKYQDDLESNIRNGPSDSKPQESVNSLVEKYRADLLASKISNHQKSVKSSPKSSSSSRSFSRRPRSRSRSKSPTSSKRRK